MSEQKEWAREHYKGVEASLKTPFSADFEELDEEGTRLNVRQNIRHGFFSTMCSSTYTTLAEQKRILEIACQEGAGRILVGAMLATLRKHEDRLELLAHAGKIGCSHAFVDYPRALKPQSEDEVVRYLREYTDATRLPIILYGFDCPSLRRFHPSGMPPAVYDQLADVPNVVGMKLTQPISIASAFELCERLAGRVLFGPANLEQVPILARHYRVQWLGQWVVESVQSPEKPYLVEFMHEVNASRIDAAMKLFWQMAPAYRYVHRLQEDYLVRGGHPWAHINYYQWCVGSNGGLPRSSPNADDEAAVLDAAGRREIRDWYARIGIEVTAGPEEEFVVGKTNYAKGVRRVDMPRTPFYRQ
jgi:4-hydroxy-tetrahydrodipicolinate synthase